MWICVVGFACSLFVQPRLTVFYAAVCYLLHLAVVDIERCLIDEPQQYRMNRRQYREFIRGLKKQGYATRRRTLQ